MIDMHQYMNEFLSGPPKDICIFGAGCMGENVFRWLDRRGLADRVRLFIDDVLYQPHLTVCGRPVEPSSFLAANPHLTVLTAGIKFNRMRDFLKAKAYDNEILFSFSTNFADYDQYSSLAGISDYSQKVRSVYNLGDRYTRELIDLYFLCKDHDGIFIHPETPESSLRELMDKAYVYPEEYWPEAETSLERFAEITFIDGGACDGASLFKLIDSGRVRLSRALCFEPDRANCLKLGQRLKKAGLDGLAVVHEAGLDAKAGTFLVKNSGTDGACLVASDGPEATVRTVALDDFDFPVTGKLCIKMDIEGFELAALQGMRQTIIRRQPELAVCLYHKKGDILAIADYIRSLVPQYNCIIRGGQHMICYASVERFGKGLGDNHE